MRVLIRPADMADYDAICALYRSLDELHVDAHPERFVLLEPARSREDIAAAMGADDQTILVAQTGETVVGFAHLFVKRGSAYPVQLPRVIGVVDGLVVDRDSRSHGVGRALMTASEEWFSSRGAECVELNVYAFNTSALAFYQANGFEPLMARLAKKL